jgi:hypothetical protein
VKHRIKKYPRWIVAPMLAPESLKKKKMLTSNILINRRNKLKIRLDNNPNHIKIFKLNFIRKGKNKRTGLWVNAATEKKIPDLMCLF